MITFLFDWLTGIYNPLFPSLICVQADGSRDKRPSLLLGLYTFRWKTILVNPGPWITQTLCTGYPLPFYQKVLGNVCLIGICAFVNNSPLFTFWKRTILRQRKIFQIKNRPDKTFILTHLLYLQLLFSQTAIIFVNVFFSVFRTK